MNTLKALILMRKMHIRTKKLNNELRDYGLYNPEESLYSRICLYIGITSGGCISVEGTKLLYHSL